MSMLKKKILLECGCGCGSCIGGCCFPRTYTDPLYPRGVLRNLYWVIDAPLCGEIDGKTGVFYPIDPTAINQVGSCGPCACYANIVDGGDVLRVTGSRWVPLSMCQQTPCSVGLCFFLSCDSAEPAPDNPMTDCCKRFRVIVGTDVSDGQVTGGSVIGGNTDGCEFLKNESVCATNLFGEIPPITCECAPDDGGVTAVFDLSSIGLGCSGVIVGGLCDGYPNCCSLFGCDLTGATLTVSPTP